MLLLSFFVPDILPFRFPSCLAKQEKARAETLTSILRPLQPIPLLKARRYTFMYSDDDAAELGFRTASMASPSDYMLMKCNVKNGKKEEGPDIVRARLFARYAFATRTSVLFSFIPSMMAPRPAMFWR